MKNVRSVKYSLANSFRASEELQGCRMLCKQHDRLHFSLNFNYFSRMRGSHTSPTADVLSFLTPQHIVDRRYLPPRTSEIIYSYYYLQWMLWQPKLWIDSRCAVRGLYIFNWTIWNGIKVRECAHRVCIMQKRKNRLNKSGRKMIFALRFSVALRPRSARGRRWESNWRWKLYFQWVKNDSEKKNSQQVVFAEPCNGGSSPGDCIHCTSECSQIIHFGLQSTLYNRWRHQVLHKKSRNDGEKKEEEEEKWIKKPHSFRH